MNEASFAPAPPDYEPSQAADSHMWVERSLAQELRRLGFGLHSDGDLSRSDYAGRKPLGQLRLADGKRLLVREYNHGGLLRWLTGRRFKDPERPFRELCLADELRRSGIPTPQVVAARARRAGWIGWNLCLVTREVEGTVDLAELLTRHGRGEGASWPLRRLLPALGAFLARLHGAGLFHADLQPANLLLARSALAGGTCDFWVLDLDRSRLSQPLSERERAANLARFLRHVERRQEEGGGALPRSALPRFLSGYCEDRGERRRLVEEIARERRAHLALHRLGWWLERRLGRGTRERPGA